MTNVDWRIERALERCVRLFPRMYRDAQADHPAVLSWAEQFRSDPDNCPSLLLLGPTGVGKTHQAFGAVRAGVATIRPTDWIATTAADLYADLRPSGGLDYAKVAKCPLLLVDDIGAAKHTDWTEEISYRLINTRYQECRPTIFTSNVSPGQLTAALGERIASRLVGMCTRVTLTGDDRRRTAAA